MPIKNEKGEVVLFLLSFKDISESFGKSHHYTHGDGEARLHAFPAVSSPTLIQTVLTSKCHTATCVYVKAKWNMAQFTFTQWVL